MTTTSNNDDFAVLVVAKAPVPGLAKTRLAADVGDRAAAEIAAAALLDTLQVVAATPARNRIVAITGDLTEAVRGADVRDALKDFIVIEQRGHDLGHRLVHAHSDTAAIVSGPIVQIGMDTPQLTPQLLLHAGRTLQRSSPTAMLGMAEDGGWWAFGVQSAGVASAISGVPMSQPDTGEQTRAVLREIGVRVLPLATLRDVDDVTDLRPVAKRCSLTSQFSRAVSSLCYERSA